MTTTPRTLLDHTFLPPLIPLLYTLVQHPQLLLARILEQAQNLISHP